MAYGQLFLDTIQSSTTGTPPQFNDGSGTQIGTLCRAWVNFNGTTSPGTIRAAFNVSSVTKNGTADYIVNFTNAMVDANYCVSTAGSQTSIGFAYLTPYGISASPYLTTSVRVLGANGANAASDITYGNVSVFR